MPDNSFAHSFPHITVLQQQPRNPPPTSGTLLDLTCPCSRFACGADSEMASGGLFGAGPLTPVGDRLFGVEEEELPLNTSGLAVLIVVYQGTRLGFALSHQTKLGYVRSVVSRYVGQDVSLWQPRLDHVISQRLPDEAIVGVLQRAPSIVAVAAGTEMPSSHPDSHPDKANPSEIATANAVTAERERARARSSSSYQPSGAPSTRASSIRAGPARPTCPRRPRPLRRPRRRAFPSR